MNDFFPGKVYNYSLLAACDCKGFLVDACRLLNHAAVGEGFTTTNQAAIAQWLDEKLLPVLQPYPCERSVVVMDGASCHHQQYLFNRLREQGIEVVVLPPYR